MPSSLSPLLGWVEIPLGDLERAEAFYGQVCDRSVQREIRRIERITVPEAVGFFGHFIDCERHRAGMRALA